LILIAEFEFFRQKMTRPRSSTSISMNHVGDVASQRSRKDSRTDISDEKPDGGWGWVILISSFLISFILDGIMYSFGKYDFSF